MGLIKSTAHFSERELKCKCGCEYTGMDEEFMEMIESLRVAVGKPLGVSSAYRCSEHNAKVSSTGPNGPHTTRQAIDLRCYGNRAHEVLEAAVLEGFTGIGVSQNGNHAAGFIHLDTLTGNNRPWVWSY